MVRIATADEAGLADVYRRIDELAVSDTRTSAWRPRESIVHWPAGAALAIALLGSSHKFFLRPVQS